MKNANLASAILVVFSLSNCSTKSPSSNDVADGGDHCVGTAAGYCASGDCPQTWSAVQNKALWCDSTQGGRPPNYGPTVISVSTSCMGFDIAYAQSGKDTTREYYYDHATGELVAVYTSVSGTLSCEVGPAGFSPPQCAVSARLFSCMPSIPMGCDTCCVPGDVSTFVPTWKPPTAFNQGACTDAQTTAFVDCLSGMPDAATCKAFGADPANTTCLACAATPSTAAKYGPLVEGTVTIAVNVAGCIANTTGDISATGCGAKTLALSQCESAACEANCPVVGTDDGTMLMALLTCQDNAGKDAKTCMPYANAAGCADPLEADGGIASVCALNGATFADNAKPMVKLFCGGIVGDAGAREAGDGG